MSNASLPEIPLYWLTTTRPDKTRVRRTCLGCGDEQEIVNRQRGVETGYAQWVRAHTACKSLFPDPAKAEDPALTMVEWEPPAPKREMSVELPTCSRCGFAGVEIVRDGLCGPCVDTMALHGFCPVEERRGMTIVDGYLKTWPANPDAGTLYVVKVVPVDGHVYTPAVFALSEGVTMDEYPVSKCRGVRVTGEKELCSFHDAVGRGLAWLLVTGVEAENNAEGVAV